VEGQNILRRIDTYDSAPPVHESAPPSYITFSHDEEKPEVSKAQLEHDAHVRFNLALVNISAGLFEKALENLTLALEARLSLKGPAHPMVASAYDKLGDVRVEMGDYDEAIKNYNSAIQVTKLKEDDNSLKFASQVLLKKAQALLETKTSDSALDCFAEAVTTLKRCSEEDDETISATLVKMGFLFLEKGDHSNALKCFAQVLENENTEKDHAIYHEMALIHMRMGDYEMAMRYFKDTLPMKKSEFGENHLEVASVLRHIAFVYFTKGEYDIALSYYEEALAVLKLNTFDFEEIVGVLSYIVDIYIERSQFDKVIKHNIDLLNMAKVELGEDCIEVATVLHKVGSCYAKMDMYKKAISCFKKEGKIRLKHGDDPKQVSTLLMHIATLYQDQKLWDEALIFYEKSVLHLTHIPSSDDHSQEEKEVSIVDELKKVEVELEKVGDEKLVVLFADTMNDMGNLYSKKGSYDEALCCYETSLQIKSKTIFCSMEENFGTKTNIGWVLCKMKSFDVSIKCLEEVLRDQRQLYEQDNADLASTLSMLGKVNAKAKHYIKAFECHADALKIRENVLRKGDPLVGKSLSDMAKILYGQHQCKQSWELCEKALKVFNQAELLPNHQYVADTRKLIKKLIVTKSN